MGARVRIFGSALGRLGEKAANEAVDEAMDAGLDSARSLVPILSGDLHDDLDIVEPASGGRGSYGVTGDLTDYAEHVEFGTEKAQAQPYLRPSIDAMKQRLR